MEDLQSWFEVPSIAHFCSLFRVAFNLIDFDIEELEEALLTDGVEDMGSNLLQELIVRLLKGSIGNEVTSSNYQMFLRRLFRKKCQEREQENPFDSDLDFQFLPLRTKVEILHNLCDFRLDSEDVMDALKNLEADSLRVEPLGYDDARAAYWYFYGTRLYKEDNALDNEDHEEDLNFVKKKTKKKTNDNKKRWKVVCYTEEDWRKLCNSFASSTSREEKSLYRTLLEDFLPEIPNLFAEKERQQKKRLEDQAPRRASARIEKLKEQRVESDRAVAEALQAEFDNVGTERPRRSKKIDEDEWQNLRNKADRATRALLREISRDNVDLFSSVDSSQSRTGSVDSSLPDNPDLKSAPTDKKPEKEKPKENVKEKANKTAGKKKAKQSTATQPKKKGRLTNNSLSSVLDTDVVAFDTSKNKPRKEKILLNIADLRMGMTKVMEHVKNHPDAWPFLDPVDEDFAPDYYTKIIQPMDLEKMESRIADHYYNSIEEFVGDFSLIVDNCKNYNGEDSEYSSMVDSLSDEFHRLVSRYLEAESSGSELSDSDSGSDNSLCSIRKEKKSKSHGELVKLVRAVNEGSQSKVKLKTEDVWDTPDSSDTEKHCKKNRKLKSEKKGKTRKKNDNKHMNAINALDAATEKSLKDTNKYLEDTPKFSEYNSPSSSPKAGEELQNPGSEKNTGRKLKTVSGKKKGLIVLAARAKQLNAEVKTDKEQQLADPKKSREIPGKDKGLRNSLERLGSNKPKMSKVSRPDESKLSSVIAKIKESRYSALQKQTADLETKPQLSLGTVLCSDIDIPLAKTESPDEESLEKDDPVRESKAPEPPEPKEEPVEPKETVAEPQSATPNLSAWFKAFGAPKSLAGTKRKASESEKPPAPAKQEPVAWFNRMEKKDSPTKTLSSLWSSASSSAIETKSREEEKPTNQEAPASPADSLGSAHSPAPSSVESIRSPATPTSGGWGGNRFSTNGESAPVHSPEAYGSPAPLVAAAPIRVGFYQDMSPQYKGASPSSTNPNSPLQQQQPISGTESSANENHRPPVEARPVVDNHRLPAEARPLVENHRPGFEARPLVENRLPGVEARTLVETAVAADTGYPLKKRGTPLAIPTPVVASARPVVAQPSQYAPVVSSGYQQQGQQPVYPPAQVVHNYGPGGSSSLPGNLASLSQIVARIPTSSTATISPPAESIGAPANAPTLPATLPQQQQLPRVPNIPPAVPTTTPVTSLPGYQNQNYQVSQPGPFFGQQQQQQQQYSLPTSRPSQQHYPATPSTYVSNQWGPPPPQHSAAQTPSSSSATPAYRAAGNSAFTHSLGYDSMMSGSLLFGGLEHSLAGNSAVFSRNALSRSSPWGTPSLNLEAVGSNTDTPTTMGQMGSFPSRVAPSAASSKTNSRTQASSDDTQRTNHMESAAAATNLGFSYNPQGQTSSGDATLLYGRNPRVAAQAGPSLPHAFLNSSLSANARTSSASSSSSSGQGHVTIPPPAHQVYPNGGPGAPHQLGPHTSFVPGMHSSFLSGQTPHHPLDPASSSTLYHQILQQHRHQQEELLLRSPHPSMVLHQSGLLGSPAGYPSGFTPGLGPLQQPFQGWL